MTAKCIALLVLVAACGCHRPMESSPDSDAGNSTEPSCADNNGDCDPSATCIQRLGSRLCICKPWMQGNGLTCAPTGLQEGSPWPVEGGNVQNTGQSPFVAAQTNDHVRRVQLGPKYSPGWASVVIDADGTLYASGGNTLYALDPSTAFSGGAPKWSYLPEASAIDLWGTPAIAKDGLLYTPYFGKLYSLDSKARDSSNRVRWLFWTEDISRSAPVIAADGTVLIGSYYHKPPLSYGVLYAFGPDTNPRNPQPKWSSPNPRPNGLSPALGNDGTVFIGGEDGMLYAFAQDGLMKWSFASGGMTFRSAVAGDGTVFLANQEFEHRGALVAVDPAAPSRDKRVRWSIQFGSALTSLAVGADDIIYVGSADGKLFAVNPAVAGKEASVKWTFQAKARIPSVVIGGDGMIYAGSDDHSIYAVRPNGTEQWSYATGEAIRTLSIGADGTVYATSDDGYLYAIGP
jgi:outer membrane protein assembly factor BamB